MLVLTFHRVEAPTGLEITRVGPRRFARLVTILRDTGLQVAAVGSDPLADGADVVLTFDDGFASAAENALPVIREQGWTAIVFLIAGAIGKDDDWDVRILGRKRSMMTWAQAREWSQAGIEFGSHTVTHADLTALSSRALERELAESRQRISDELGAPVRYLAYPFGRHHERVRAAAREAGYAAAFASDATLDTGDDRFAISRVTVHGLMTLFQYRRLLAQAVDASSRSWFGRARTRLFTSLSAGSAIATDLRRIATQTVAGTR
ncbi:MAG: polysaccharide deacetylase family protein [Candidatus Zixiibacteriota bacterium]